MERDERYGAPGEAKRKRERERERESTRLPHDSCDTTQQRREKRETNESTLTGGDYGVTLPFCGLVERKRETERESVCRTRESLVFRVLRRGGGGRSWRKRVIVIRVEWFNLVVPRNS